jgi:hypothetical protein
MIWWKLRKENASSIVDPDEELADQFNKPMNEHEYHKLINVEVHEDEQ